MFNISSAMAAAFVDATEEMTRQIAAIGPNPLRQVKKINHDAPTPAAGE